MIMTIRVLLDTSAYLALINDEPGGEMVQFHMTDSCMSTVNITEVVAYLIRNGYNNKEKIQSIVNVMRPLVYDKDVAIVAGEIITHTKHLGLSLGDRACLASARLFRLPVYTADKKWSEVADVLNINIFQIR